MLISIFKHLKPRKDPNKEAVQWAENLEKEMTSEEAASTAEADEVKREVMQQEHHMEASTFKYVRSLT